MEKVMTKIGSIDIELTNGTMVRVAGEEPYYLDLGICPNGNRVLFYYADASVVVDYVQTIIDNLPDFAAQYLENVLNTNNNVLVRLWDVTGNDSCFEIYYDSDCQSNDIMEVIDWMGHNNDFAAAQYRYTQVKNGRQAVCE